MELQEKIARAMAEYSGWNKWDSAKDFCDTPAGNDPKDERDYWLCLADLALKVIEENKRT